MATTQTTNLNLSKPEIGGETDTWGQLLNTNSDLLDAAVTARLEKASNLSDLVNAQTARTNLGLGSAAVQNDDRYAHRSNNLSDLANATTARTNLGANSATNLTTGTLPAARLPTSGVSASSLTTGTLPDARLSSNVPVVSSQTLSLSSPFSGSNQLRLTRVGDMRFLQAIEDIAFTSGTTAGNVGIIPSADRPPRGLSWTIWSSSVTVSMEINNLGTLTLWFYNSSGSQVAATSIPYGFSVSWSV